MLQSVMKGHLERSRSLNQYDDNSERSSHHRHESKSRSPSTPRSSHKQRPDSSSQYRNHSPQNTSRMSSRQRYHSPQHSSRLSHHHYQHSETPPPQPHSSSRLRNYDGHHRPQSNTSMRHGRKQPVEVYSGSDSDGQYSSYSTASAEHKRMLIEKKVERSVQQADEPCCSPWRSRKK